MSSLDKLILREQRVNEMLKAIVEPCDHASVGMGPDGKFYCQRCETQVARLPSEKRQKR